MPEENNGPTDKEFREAMLKDFKKHQMSPETKEAINKIDMLLEALQKEMRRLSDNSIRVDERLKGVLSKLEDQENKYATKGELSQLRTEMKPTKDIVTKVVTYIIMAIVGAGMTVLIMGGKV